jgi:hypothetical protein
LEWSAFISQWMDKRVDGALGGNALGFFRVTVSIIRRPSPSSNRSARQQLQNATKASREVASCKADVGGCAPIADLAAPADWHRPCSLPARGGAAAGLNDEPQTEAICLDLDLRNLRGRE